MNFSTLSASGRRVVVTLFLAVVVSALMLAAAWIKQSAPAGSTAENPWDGVILVLAVIGLFVPMLALRLPTGVRTN
jgi:hypothetical protein